MKTIKFALLSAALLFGSISLQAQDEQKNKSERQIQSTQQRSSSAGCQMEIEGLSTATAPVLIAKSNYVGSSDVIGVEGYSISDQSGYGIGGDFIGGWRGAAGLIPSSVNTGFLTFGLYGNNESLGTGDKAGVFGDNHSSAAATKYGVYGRVSSTAENSTHIGIYGAAIGGANTTLWAGFFQGNVNVTGDITAANFIGDGSQLTNLPSSGGSGCTKYGDGTAGDLTITGATNWSTSPPVNRNFMFQNLTINAGQTLTVSSGTVIMVAENFTNNGIIEVLPGIPASRATSNINGTFPRVNGYSYDQFTPYTPDQLRFEINPSHIAGGNGEDGPISSSVTNNIQEGGSGGGSVVIRSGLSLTNNGTINAAGGNAIPHNISTQDFGGAGGGGGGFVILLSPVINNAGTINVNGGNGTNPGTGDDDHAGGGGGGGLIHFISGNADAVGGTNNINGGIPGVTPSSSIGNGGGDGGCSVGAAGKGGLDVNNLLPITQPEAGGDGIVLRTQVAEPCNLSFD